MAIFELLYYHLPKQTINANTLRLTTLALCAGTLTGCSTLDQIGENDNAPTPGDLRGNYVTVICDADMGAEALAGGPVNKHPSARDTMTIIKLPIRQAPSADANTWQTDYAQFPVGNSVLGPPTALAVSPDGTQAFVVEHRGGAPMGAATINDLPAGSSVTSIDLTNPLAPGNAMRVEVGRAPMTVDVHPSGELLAVTTRRDGEQLVLVPVSARIMGQALGWPLLGLDDSQTLASCVAWDPTGRYLAITLPERNQVAFYEFTRNAGNGAMGLAPWGEPVSVGQYSYSGKWTPDGQHFITTDLHWSGDELSMVGAPEGTLSVIRVSDVPSAVASDGQPEPIVQHQVVSTARVGVSPEGLAISPDGRWVVTANLRRSMLPGGGGGDASTRGGSLSLLSLDRGSLTNHGEFPIDAMPEGLAFDRTGRNIVVTQFRSFDPNAVDGELAIFKIVGGAGGSPRLVQGDTYIGVGVGPHGVVIVR